MIRVLLLASAMAWPGPGTARWFGADKIKHFLLSALVQSVTYSSARAVRVDRAPAQAMGGAAVLGVGVLKEIHDRRSGKPFSIEDLFWDSAGGISAAALLNGTR